jgi:primosomal replication protein N
LNHLPRNHLQLEAAVVERESVRYTPAGVPIVSCTLHHRAEVVEAGVSRQVEMTLQALVAGELAGALERCELGVNAHFAGFLALRSRNARTLVFHITEIQHIGKD